MTHRPIQPQIRYLNDMRLRLRQSLFQAAMAPDRETFDMLVDPVYDYVNESPRRFPLGDWYGTVDCMPIQFRARSVIAGHWMPVLMMKTSGSIEEWL